MTLSTMAAQRQHVEHESRNASNDSREDHIRMNDSLVQSSETAKQLFGLLVGPCFGDFYCTNNRIRGRFYATSHAILFYSNILGYERRLSLFYRDIEDMSLYRSTSIAVSTVDCETYIFKSFNDRQTVLSLLKRLESLEIKSTSRSSLQTELNASQLSIREETPADMTDCVLSQPPSTTTPSRLPQSIPPLSSSSSLLALNTTLPPPGVSFANRRRSVSDSIVNTTTPISTPRSTSFTFSTPTRRPKKPLPVTREASAVATSTTTSPGVRWETVNQPVVPALDGVCIECVQLSCSLDQFVALFLKDEAASSLSKFQSETIQDRDVSISSWIEGTEIGSMNRILTFSHPIKGSAAFGPDFALTRREQTLRKFPGEGLSLDNVTKVEGIPAADSFHVQDRWLVESIEEGHGVRLSARYGIRFTKRSLLKPLIQNSIRRETKEWWVAYVEFLKAAVDDDKRKNGVTTRTVKFAGTDSYMSAEEVLADQVAGLTRLIRNRFILFAVFLVAVYSVHSWLLYNFYLEIISLNESIDQLRHASSASCHGGL